MAPFLASRHGELPGFQKSDAQPKMAQRATSPDVNNQHEKLQEYAGLISSAPDVGCEGEL